MTAQLVILAFGVCVFVAVAWWDRRQERRRRWAEEQAAFAAALRSVQRAIGEQLLPAFQSMIPAVNAAAKAVGQLGAALTEERETP